MLNEKIPMVVNRIVRKYGTNDPWLIADYLGVTVIELPAGNHIAGYYKYIKRNKYIFINSEITDYFFRRIVLAHELGHSVLHRTDNCTFMGAYTLMLTSKIEIQANIFASHLLITEADIEDYKDFTIEQFASCSGYPKELIDLKLEYS